MRGVVVLWICLQRFCKGEVDLLRSALDVIYIYNNSSRWNGIVLLVKVWYRWQRDGIVLDAGDLRFIR